MSNKPKVFKESAERMRKVRSVLGYTQDKMGSYFGIQEVLSFYYKFKLEYPELVNSPGNKNPG